MAFLRALLTRLQCLPGRNPSASSSVPPSVELGDRERLTRFIHSRSKFGAGRAKPGAFDPSPYDRLSVAHVSGLGDEATWALSRLTLRPGPGRDRVYARADFEVAAATRWGLRALRDDTPFERHTSIVGWPVLEGEMERKSRRLEIALDLSESAQLMLPASPILLD